MKVFDIADDQGRVFAFEVVNFGRHRVAKFLERTPGVKVIRKQKHFAATSEAVFCEFEFRGQRFLVEEPWNDSSRYWIGTDPPEWCSQLEAVRAAFAQHKAWWLL